MPRGKEPATIPPQHKATAYEAALATSQTRGPPTLHHSSWHELTHLTRSSFAQQADRRGPRPDRNAARRVTRELREENEATRRRQGSHWLPLSDEQHRQRATTAKSLAPPLRELLRMNRELRDEVRGASEDAQPALPHPDIQPDYDPSQDLLVNFSWMEADEVIVEPSTDYFAPHNPLMLP